ncbi:MAG: DNA-binding response regulator [Acidobacteriia bacterium 12-62-4]|nr:MAG: DNA-binding response regulator [Acidobacteriia bacterium 12-62-4]
MPFRILLADDHTLVRQGLRRILETQPGLQVVAEASTGVEAVNLALEHGPDLALLDVGMKGLNGLEALTQLRRNSPNVAVLMLSMHADERYVLRGYVLKDCVEEELIAAILAVRRGRRFFSPEVDRFLRLRNPNESLDDRYERLTDRERHIYQLLAEGNSNKEIAHQLSLSLHTIETHRARIMEKLGLHSAAELVLSAVRRGIVS